MTHSTTNKRALLTNAVSNWAGFVAQMALAFVLAPVLVHGLGDRRYGVWSLVESVLAYLMLFDLGIAASVVRFVARFEATGDRTNLNRVFSTSLCLFGAAGAVALVLALALAVSLGTFWNVPPDLLTEARWMMALLGVNIAIGLPLGVFPSVLDGLGRYPIKTTIRTAAVVLRSGLFVAVIWTGRGLVELAWAITACNLGENLLMAVVAHRLLPGLRFSFGFVDRETFRSIRGYSLDAFLAMLAGRISFQTDAIVIGLFLGAEFITFFAVAARLVEYAKNALRAATTVLTPAISALEAKGDHDAIRRVFVDSTRWVLWCILPVQAGMLVLGRPFLTLWMGERYAELSYPTLLLLTLPLGLAMSQSVSGRIVYGMGRLRWYARVMMAEAACNLVLSVVLAGPLGIEGVAIGTAVPNVVFNVVVAVAVCRMLGVGVGQYAWRAFAGPCGVAAVLMLGWGVAVAWLPARTWTTFCLLGTAGVAGYSFVVWLVEVGLPVNLTPPARERISPAPLPHCPQEANGIL